MINRTLTDRYTIMESIGTGGMAYVYRAYDEILDRSVAVKMLRDDVVVHNDDFRDFIARFRMEAQSVAKLSHPNIVTMYDVGHDGDIDYIVMEYVDGETLKKKIDRDGALSEKEALRIAREIAEALEHAHENRLVHCDIKPHNILITNTGRVKVTDFGIAQAATSTAKHTNVGFIMGSAPYLSPEQARGQMADARSDLYSLGIVLYEMLTGHAPFSGQDPVIVAMKQIQEIPTPPSSWQTNISPLAEAVVMKALEKSPSNRYQTMGEMIVDLKAAEALHAEDVRLQSDSECPTILLPRITDEQLEESAPTRAETRKGSPNSSNKKKWGIAIAIVLIASFLLGSFLAYGKFWSSEDVIVPNVVGKTIDDAKHILSENKLRVSVTEQFDDNVVEGVVISQTPDANSHVKEDRTITIYVSKGEEVVVVPDVRTLALREAELTLRNAGFIIGRIEEVNDKTVPNNTVIDQNPRSPAQIKKTQKIDLIVCRIEKMVELPDFTGSRLSSVKKQLVDLNLKEGKITEVAGTKSKGTIVRQSPEAGTEVKEGSAVNFTVSKGPVDRKAETIQFKVPKGSSKQLVQIIVTDESGRDTIYERTHKSGDRINKRVVGYGNVRVQIYVDGALIQEEYL
ncbi:MAG: Stk1 family PASTA domain-containing Ser/Thr kinase [Selenomonadales bacterium]|nr:Stk1 family PASTA domain-containing Ser/Thr kinase [Selenomonadales bacterium]